LDSEGRKGSTNGETEGQLNKKRPERKKPRRTEKWEGNREVGGFR
jgi:hypothetical protein